VGADHLLPEMEADTLIADKAFDADARVLEPLASAGKTAVIPPRTNRSSPRDYDRELYAARHLIENFFAKLKQFRAIATRYEMRWPGLMGQFGGFAKLGSGSRQAANLVSSSALVPIAPYASSGVRPFSPECGRRPL
jgi:transposase